jgi:hypothetical protein
MNLVRLDHEGPLALLSIDSPPPNLFDGGVRAFVRLRFAARRRVGRFGLVETVIG